MHNQGALGYLGPGVASPSCIVCVVAALVGVVFGIVIGIVVVLNVAAAILAVAMCGVCSAVARAVALQHRACQAACQHAGPHLGELAVRGFHYLEPHGIGCLQPGERKRSAFPRRGGEPAHQSAGNFPFGFRPLLGGFAARL